MEEVATKLESSLPDGQRITNCVWVCYLGRDRCANCQLGVEHGVKRCGTTLGFHRDNGKGANSQGRTMNMTLTVGDARTLTMQVRIEHPGYTELVKTTEQTNFRLTTGSVFQLHPADEILQPRLVDGRVLNGAFYHGMQTELPGSEISCGFVFRCVQKARDVHCRSQLIIPRLKELHLASTSKLHNDAIRQRRRAVRVCWESGEAARYGNSMRKHVAKALLEWPWWEAPPGWLQAFL